MIDSDTDVMPVTATATASPSPSLRISKTGALSFLSRDGDAWKTNGPLLIMHYYDRQHPRAQSVSAPSSDEYAFGTAGTPSLSATGTLAMHEIAAGKWLAVAFFEQLHIRITLHIELHDNGFDLSICENDVQEDLPNLYRLLSLEILPDFGSAVTGEQGYLTLPNWMGCRTFFDKSYPREVRQTVYSSNDQWEHTCNMPVFGITRAQGTLCGLITHGDYDAQLVCRVHWESEQTNGVHPTLIYRWEQQDDMIPGRREVRYQFAPHDFKGGEGYVFCGQAYRQFLRTERGLQSWEEKAVTRPAAIDYRDRFFLKIFMAYKEPRADGRGKYHATCTFDEAREILQDCQRRGMKKLTAILVGWGQDGHDGMPPTRFPVDDRLGGEAAMKRLIAWCAEHDIMLGVHDSYGGAYSCSPEFEVKDLIRHRTGEYWESIIWSGGQSHIICPRVYLEKHVPRDIPAILNLGISSQGHHHIDAVGSFMTCHSNDHPLPQRADYVEYVRKMFTFAAEKMGSVSTEMPFGPYFGVVDGFFHSYSVLSPWHKASNIGRYFFDEIVPLLSVALHGSCKCCESILEGREAWAGLVAMGLAPQYEVCRRPSPSFGIPAYEDAAALLAEAYDAFYGDKDGLSQIAGSEITSIRELSAGVTETLYANGVQILVNRNNRPWKGVQPSSWQILQSRSKNRS